MFIVEIHICCNISLWYVLHATMYFFFMHCEYVDWLYFPVSVQYDHSIWCNMQLELHFLCRNNDLINRYVHRRGRIWSICHRHNLALSLKCGTYHRIKTLVARRVSLAYQELLSEYQDSSAGFYDVRVAKYLVLCSVLSIIVFVLFPLAIVYIV